MFVILKLRWIDVECHEFYIHFAVCHFTFDPSKQADSSNESTLIDVISAIQEMIDLNFDRFIQF